MATTNSTFSSFRELQALSQSVHASSSGTVTLTLPRRPPHCEAIDYETYTQEAIALLAKSARHLQNANAYVDHRVDKICNQIDKIEERMDRIDRKEDANFNVRKEIKDFKSDAYRQFDEVYRRFDETDRRFEKIDRRFDESDRRFDETQAFARNRPCTRLSSPIYKIYALVRDENGQSSYEVHPDFPVTVRDSWQLKGNISALQQLAKQYLPSSWGSWGMDDPDPDHSDVTDIAEIELAVATHPTICLRALAENWGLEYGHLERPAAGRKRKAENEAESRERKVDEGYREISLRIGQYPEKVSVGRITRSEPDVMHTSLTQPEMLKEWRVPEQPQLTPESGNVRWSTSSVDAARHQIHAATGREPASSHGPRRMRLGKLGDEQGSVTGERTASSESP